MSITKQSLINWIIVNSVDMKSNRVILPEGWYWTKKNRDGHYAAFYVDDSVRHTVTTKDVTDEIVRRLKRGNIKAEKLLRKLGVEV